MVTQNFKYVEIQEEIAYIDSRVYCREIIQVVHKDWMYDTLRKYQTYIESMFGVLRFETDKPKSPKGGRPEKYALMTEAQCNFALTLSNNTEATIQAKADLVLDFEKAKQLLKNQLQRHFDQSLTISAQLELNDELMAAQQEIGELKALLKASNLHQQIDKLDEQLRNQKLEITRLKGQLKDQDQEITKQSKQLKVAKTRMEQAERENRAGSWQQDLVQKSDVFLYDADFIYLITGLATPEYFLGCMFKNLTLSVDFVKENYSKKKHGEFHLGRHKYFLTADAAKKLVLNHRSKKGTSKREVPEMIHFLFDTSEELGKSNMNRRHLRAR